LTVKRLITARRDVVDIEFVYGSCLMLHAQCLKTLAISPYNSCLDKVICMT